MIKLQLSLCVIFLATGVLAAQVPQTNSTLPTEAESFAGRGKHASSAKSPDEVSKVSPTQESLQFREASQLFYLGKLDQAEDIFLRLAESKNSRLAALAKDSLVALREERVRQAKFEARTESLKASGAAQRATQSRQRRKLQRQEADLRDRQEIYDLFAAGETEKGLDRFETYKAGHSVPIDLQYAAIYALQREERAAEAAMAMDALPENEKSKPEWSLARGRTSRALKRNNEAWKYFDAARRAGAGTPLAHEARAEIVSLPMEANLDRWAWGELQLDAVHLFRFDDTIFYGQVREGTFVPGARWIQPFVQADFTLDTNSGVTNGVSQVYANNLAGVHAGVRIRPFAQESVWLYGLVGIQKDLRGTTRFEGAWFFDWRVGVRAYKGFGPGLTFATDREPGEESPGFLEARLRSAWFVEGGVDVAYYSLYENFIGFYEAREGIRFLELGSRIGFDIYALEQGTLDSRGLYYNNFFEVGAGLRATAQLSHGVSLITRAEAIAGSYLGRDAEQSRGNLESTYGDIRITVSLWAQW